jgi:hypothetical protein
MAVYLRRGDDQCTSAVRGGPPGLAQRLVERIDAHRAATFCPKNLTARAKNLTLTFEPSSKPASGNVLTITAGGHGRRERSDH